jgi:hypothetical protein
LLETRNWRLWLAAAALSAFIVPPSVVTAAPSSPLLEDEKKKEGEGEGEEAPAGPDEDEVRAYLKDFDKAFKKMADEDAIERVKKMTAWHNTPGIDAKLQKSIMKSLQKPAKLLRKEAVAEATAKCLGEIGGKSAVGLLKVMVGTSLKQKVPPSSIVSAGLKSLGKIASENPGDVKFLTDLLKKDDEFIGYVARALTGYENSNGKVRKQIFEELLKMSEGVFSKSEANDPVGKRRWNIWGEDVVEAMQKVSHKGFTKPPDFRKWFNDKKTGGGKNPRTWADPPKKKKS